MSTTPVTLVQRAVNPAAASRLRASGIDDLLVQLYASRGVKAPSEVRGEYRDLLPTHTMKNVLQMANYLADCAVLQKRVLIVSDYDCDGATACSILVMTFGGCGMNFGYLVPDRMVHGYGLTPAIVEEAAALDPKPDVIITVDNGISSTAGVDRANELGIEVLVTDHHLAPDVLPKAKLIVNPNQPGCEFASKNIAGCGVAWYVARALIDELAARNMDPGFQAAELLSYVAIGTVADVVKLDRNNRILISEGLKAIRAGDCAHGVMALARVSKKSYQSLTCSDIGFAIGPRINAAGRLAHMGTGIECLTTMDPLEAARLARHLHLTNEERKEIQRGMVEKAVIQATRLLQNELTAPDADKYGRRSIVVFHPDFHEGVVGVVSGRLKEDRHRPTIVMTTAEDGSIKGSGRSIPGFHLKHALDEINIKHPGVLLKFGGHAMAAGMTIAADKLDVFRDALEVVCRAGLTPEMLDKTLMHDGELPAHFLTVETVHMLSQQVWGQGFEEPVFLNTLDIVDVKVLKEVHLKMTARLGDIQTDAMLFFQGDLASGIAPKMTMAVKPGINEFRGERNVQLLVELMPEHLNPSLSDCLRAREALTIEAADASEGTSHDPSGSKPAESGQVIHINPSRAEISDETAAYSSAAGAPTASMDVVVTGSSSVAGANSYGAGQRRLSLRR
jgi:single-stranded-DNA-specific exonuclease